MSASLLRQARLAHTLSVARRSASRCRSLSALSAQPRHKSDEPVAGPSRLASSPATPETAPQDEESLEPFSRVQSYLQSINAASLEPTLEDLDRYKPAKRPPLHSPKYAAEYNELISVLCRSFTKDQLRDLLLQHLGSSRHSARSRKKVEYAASILAQIWEWPTLEELEKVRRDRTEVVTKYFPMTPSEIFLVLGKDGQDLLRLSKDHDVHISLRQSPLALRVEGPRGSVRELSEHVFHAKKAIIETYALPEPSPIPADMVQRISRLAQAYIENIPSSPGSIRIFAKDSNGMEAAKRLAGRAVHEIAENSQNPYLTFLRAGTASHAAMPLAMYPHSYALYPYVSPRSLPITVNTGGTFRLRRVGEWLNSGFTDRDDATIGLASGRGHIVTEAGDVVQLKDMLLNAVAETDGLTSTVKASLGHVLLTRASKDQRGALVPPLSGDHQFGKIRKWISNNAVKMAFVPDLPLPLLSTAPAHQKVIHRLVYHSISSTPGDALPQSGTDSHVTVHRRKVISLEATLTEPQAAKPEAFELAQAALNALGDSTEDSAKGMVPELSSLVVTEASCSSGVQAAVNVMMPDRPMDLQFTVSSTVELPVSQQPSELQEYIRNLRAFLSGSEIQSEQPTPPFVFEHEGERFLLHLNASVRQSKEEIPQAISGDATNEARRAVCESALDLESNQKSMHCEVICENPASEETWTQFLADCDRLSHMTHQSSSTSMSIPGEDLI